MTTSTTPPTREVRSATLPVPGAELAWDVRPAAPGSPAAPPLLLVGSPMAAAGFGTLSGFFPDRTVVTYDPRGSERSRRTDGATTSTPQEHADDLAAVVEAAGGGPVDVFASSGGAVNALELVVRRPELVRTLVAHEPPSLPVLPDREEASAATRAVADAYARDGFGAGMAGFIRLVAHRGRVPADMGPVPDPAAFGLPAGDDGSRDDVLLGQNLITCTHHEHDVEALRAAPVRIVLAVGEESDGELAHRGGEGMAARLGTEPVVFPGGHAGFLGGEYGQTGEPEAFAARLREVLDGAA
ncbi:alpha/beta fold hydrolase [Geodermatophilus sp. SYSU D01119]